MIDDIVKRHSKYNVECIKVFFASKDDLIAENIFVQKYKVLCM